MVTFGREAGEYRQGRIHRYLGSGYMGIHFIILLLCKYDRSVDRESNYIVDIYVYPHVHINTHIYSYIYFISNTFRDTYILLFVSTILSL